VGVEARRFGERGMGPLEKKAAASTLDKPENTKLSIIIKYILNSNEQ